MVKKRFHFVQCGRVAQLDRALASGAKGRGFESRSAHHFFRGVSPGNPPFFFFTAIHHSITANRHVKTVGMPVAITALAARLLRASMGPMPHLFSW